MLTVVENPLFTAIKEFIKLDSSMQATLPKGYAMKDGLVYFDGRIVVPESQKIKEALYHMYHTSPLLGHGGVRKTYKAMAETFFWKNMMIDIKALVKGCRVCQQVKSTVGKLQGLLQPLPIPEGPWEELTMDFIVGLPPSKGHVAIMVIVDRFKKTGHFFPLKKGYTASKVAKVFVNNVVKLHGFPRSILTNRDPLFMSQFWEQLMQYNGTKLLHTTAYHPECDGQTEVTN